MATKKAKRARFDVETELAMFASETLDSARKDAEMLRKKGWKYVRIVKVTTVETREVVK